VFCAAADSRYCHCSHSRRFGQAENDALMAGRGKVSFVVSCDANLQPRFDAALAALHSFWYGQALNEFTSITEADPNCAMSYWGIAMSVWNQLWAPPALYSRSATHLWCGR
jgi:hypothetical protein